MNNPERVIYLPIEPYKARYTEYTSVANGCYETTFRKAGVEFLSIRPHNNVLEIRNGLVLDPLQRAYWSFSQTTQLMELMQQGYVKPETDVIYIEDLWHPGFEMIPYMQHTLYGNEKFKHVPVYAFCHAQTTDPYDFTHPWKSWMRPMERGWIDYLSGVFCAAKEMAHQFAAGGLDYQKLMPVGHMFHGDVLLTLAGIDRPARYAKRRKEVVFSARFDSEKNPDFFVAVAREVLRHDADVHFTFCSGHKLFKSNDPVIASIIHALKRDFPHNVHIKLNLDKSQYYRILSGAKVNFNCADQDFISYTLLEATLFGCAPLYPNYLTFPDALNHQDAYLYKHKDVVDAVRHLLLLLARPDGFGDYDWVWKKYETTGYRMLSQMGFNTPSVPNIITLNNMALPDLQKTLEGRL